MREYRRDAKAFTRPRILTFPILILFLLNLLKGALQTELNGFFNISTRAAVAMRKVTAQAFCKARAKILFGAFIALNQRLVDSFYADAPVHKWKGFTLFAIDGTTLRLPYSEEILEEFGGMPLPDGRIRPLAQAISVYDVLNEMTVAASAMPYVCAEVTMTMDLLSSMGDLTGSLLLMDRGFAAFPLLNLIKAQGGHFVVRIKSNMNVIKQLKKTGKHEGIFDYQIDKNSSAKAKCKKYGISARSISVRIIEIPWDGEEGYLYLMTNLLDPAAFPYGDFSDLYHLRWFIEENYKRKKSREEIENFTAKSVNGLKQDFHAKVFTENLAVALAHRVAAKVREDNCSLNRKYDYKINFTQLLSSFKDTVVRVLKGAEPRKILAQLQELWRITLTAIRPGRKFIRKSTKENRRPKVVGFYFPYKRTT